MKRKSWMTTIVLRVMLAIAVVSVTIYSIVPHTNNAGGNTVQPTADVKTDPQPTEMKGTGTKDDPYVIYTADDFFASIVGKYTDESGNYIDYN